MNKCFIITALLFAFLSTGWSRSRCECPDDNNPVIIHTDPSLIVCGNVNMSLSNTSFTFFDYKIYDCSTGIELLTQTERDYPKDIITQFDDSLVVEKTHCVLDANNIISFVPATAITLKFQDKEIVRMPERNVFVAPKLTKEQQTSLTALIKNLKQKVKRGKNKKVIKTKYPADEKSVYLLFTAAAGGNKEAKYYFQNLEQFFILNETTINAKNEIWLKF